MANINRNKGSKYIENRVKLLLFSISRISLFPIIKKTLVFIKKDQVLIKKTVWFWRTTEKQLKELR